MINTEVKIPLDDSVVIDSVFKPNHLPHILGLNKLSEKYGYIILFKIKIR